MSTPSSNQQVDESVEPSGSASEAASGVEVALGSLSFSDKDKTPKRSESEGGAVVETSSPTASQTGEMDTTEKEADAGSSPEKTIASVGLEGESGAADTWWAQSGPGEFEGEAVWKRPKEPTPIWRLRFGCRATPSQLPTCRGWEEVHAQKYSVFLHEYVAAGYRCPAVGCGHRRNSPVGGLPVADMREATQLDRDAIFRHMESCHFVGEGRASASGTCSEEGCGHQFVVPNRTDIRDHLTAKHGMDNHQLRELCVDAMMHEQAKRPKMGDLGKITAGEARSLRRVFLARERCAQDRGVSVIPAEVGKQYEILRAVLQAKVDKKHQRYGKKFSSQPTLVRAQERAFWEGMMKDYPPEESAALDVMFHMDLAAELEDAPPLEASRPRSTPQSSPKGKGAGKGGKGGKGQGASKQTAPPAKPKETEATATESGECTSSPSESESEEAPKADEKKVEVFVVQKKKRKRSHSRKSRGSPSKRANRDPSPEPKSTPMDHRAKEEEKRRASMAEKAAQKVKTASSQRRQESKPKRGSGYQKKPDSKYQSVWDLNGKITEVQKKMAYAYNLRAGESRANTSTGLWFGTNMYSVLSFVEEFAGLVEPFLKDPAFRDGAEATCPQFAAWSAYMAARAGKAPPSGSVKEAGDSVPPSKTPSAAEPCPRCNYPGKEKTQRVQTKDAATSATASVQKPAAAGKPSAAPPQMPEALKHPPVGSAAASAKALGGSGSAAGTQDKSTYSAVTKGEGVPVPPTSHSKSAATRHAPPPGMVPLGKGPPALQRRLAPTTPASQMASPARAMGTPLGSLPSTSWAPETLPSMRSFQPGPAEGWLDGEPEGDRRSKALVTVLPKAWVEQQMLSKRQELAMLESCVECDEVYANPSLLDQYLKTTGDCRKWMERMPQSSAGFSFTAPRLKVSRPAEGAPDVD